MPTFTGIYAAAVTPMDAHGELHLDAYTDYLHHLRDSGCHGALIAGTTSEAPSLSVDERLRMMETATNVSDLILLAGTGASSLPDTIALTRAAYNMGYAATVIIPPFFWQSISEDGLRRWYDAIMTAAVPSDGRVLLYHNPVATAVGLPLTLIEALRDAYPDQMVGIKDSSQEPATMQALNERLPGFDVLVGDDKLLADNLNVGGMGSITLLANMASAQSRQLYDAHQAGDDIAAMQADLTTTWHSLDGTPRIAAIKAILHHQGWIPTDTVRPPQRPLTDAERGLLIERGLLA